MGQELVVPDTFDNFKPPAAMAALNPQDDTLSAGIGQSYGVIGYKGKVWSLRVRGERHNILRPDDGTPSNHIDVVILGSPAHKSKSYYDKFVDGVEGSRPICASLDGLVPDQDVTLKQSDTCALCPRNEWKINATTGRKGKECQDYKRLAVVVMPYQTAPLLGGVPLVEPVFLRVPPASLTSLAVMGDTMSGRGLHFAHYVTRISFDPNEASPKMMFKPIVGITPEEAPVIMELMADPSVKRIIYGDVVLSGPKQIAPATQTQAPVASTPAQPSTQPAAASPVESGILSGLGSAQPVIDATTPTAPAAAPVSTPSEPAPTGFGGVTSLAAARAASSQSSEPTPVPPSTADTGAPEASDVDLDAKIAGLLKTN